MNKNTYVVIMAGGVGSRFWPASRENMPKQFMDLLGVGKSLLAQTVERFRQVCPLENILIVTNDSYADLVKEQIPDISEDQILLESIGRNTAPCIAYAAFRIAAKDPGAVMIVAPSDHAIFNDKVFCDIMNEAVEAASKDDILITLGIKPRKPETGYGYIQYIEGAEHLKKVKTFTEKPELSLARKFIESGDFVWNSGMFIWQNKSILKALKEFLPDVYEVFHETEDKLWTDEEPDAIRMAYSLCKNISVDYGIMEKASNVYVIPAEFDWSDLGSWSALHEISPRDENNNYTEGNVLLFDVKDSVIAGPPDSIIVADSLKGYLVAQYGNALLICKKDDERKFRQIYNDLKKKGNDFL